MAVPTAAIPSVTVSSVATVCSPCTSPSVSAAALPVYNVVVVPSSVLLVLPMLGIFPAMRLSPIGSSPKRVTAVTVPPVTSGSAAAVAGSHTLPTTVTSSANAKHRLQLRFFIALPP